MGDREGRPYAGIVAELFWCRGDHEGATPVTASRTTFWPPRRAAPPLPEGASLTRAVPGPS